MAAGGSAPELFSSLFGTFQESEIGIGTIIGSAVFNVLFVIAFCAFFSKEILNLTWWPLFRDSIYYAIGLVVLSIFIGVTSKNEIELWEACILFGMYFFYIFIMWNNAAIYRYLTGKEVVYPGDDDDDIQSTRGEDADQDAAPVAGEQRPSIAEQGKGASTSSISSQIQLRALKNILGNSSQQLSGGRRWHGTFRAGILKLMRNPQSWVERGGVGIVAKLAGDADQIFREVDANGDGIVDKDELRALFHILDYHVTEQELDDVFKELDTDGDGVISREEFNRWYTQSAELVRSQTRYIFDYLDTDESGTLDKEEIKVMLEELDPNINDEDVKEAIDAMCKHGSGEEITYTEFEEWYEHSMIYERQKKAIEEDMDGVSDSLEPPYGEGLLAWLQYIIVFPLLVCMVYTIPDVRKPGWGSWCYVAFLLSIAWIGGFAYLMVDWAEIIGNTLGIPSVLMGLTILAAGTSVPDLLTSVIVARRGEGDMAISSSIGSNIFDILVGLPLPWIMFTAWPTTDDVVQIGSDNIWTSIFILIGMLVFVVSSIHCKGWKLTKSLGWMMLFLYFGFLLQAILLELPFETCVSG